MTDRVDPAGVEARFRELTYPVTRDDAAAAFRDVVVSLDGEEANLGRAISEVGSDAFQDPADLLAEVEGALDTDLPDGLPWGGDGDD